MADRNLTLALQGEDRQTIGNMFYGFKNILINGDKRVNQREYTDGALANGDYGYDMWMGADSDANIEQIIEQQNINSGTYTISWVGGGTATIAGISGLSSGDNLVITVIGNIYVKVPKTATNIQLEPDDVATPFEQRPIGLELSLCQRYAYVINNGSGTERHGIGSWNSSTAADITVVLPEPMRIVPTLTIISSKYGRVLDPAVAWHAVTALSLASETTNKLLVLSTTSGASAATQADSAMFGGDISDPLHLIISAEL